MAEVQLRDPTQNRQLSQQQVDDLQKAYGQFKNQLVEQEKQSCKKQIEKIKDALANIQEIKGKVTISIDNCSLTIKTLRKRTEELEQKIKKYEEKYANSNQEDEYKGKIKEEEANYIACCKRRIQIASEIDMKQLKKMDLEERTSKAHQVFKWILVCMYLQPENKYYWPNFKEQAIDHDKGEDLRARLGKIKALDAKDQQRVKTTKFLSRYKEIEACPEFKDFGREVSLIHEIANIYLRCSDIGRSIKEYEVKIRESREKSQKGDEKNIQNKKNYNALRERIAVAEEYLGQLQNLEKGLANKETTYYLQIGLGEEYLKELESIKSYVEKAGEGIKMNQKEERQNCECTLF